MKKRGYLLKVVFISLAVMLTGFIIGYLSGSRSKTQINTRAVSEMGENAPVTAIDDNMADQLRNNPKIIVDNQIPGLCDFLKAFSFTDLYERFCKEHPTPTPTSIPSSFYENLPSPTPNCIPPTPQKVVDPNSNPALQAQFDLTYQTTYQDWCNDPRNQGCPCPALPTLTPLPRSK